MNHKAVYRAAPGFARVCLIYLAWWSCNCGKYASVTVWQVSARTVRNTHLYYHNNISSPNHRKKVINVKQPGWCILGWQVVFLKHPGIVDKHARTAWKPLCTTARAMMVHLLYLSTPGWSTYRERGSWNLECTSRAVQSRAVQCSAV